MNSKRTISNFYKFSPVNFSKKNPRKLVFICFLLILFLSLIIAEAQDLPKEIRGYKVYQAKISVKNESEQLKSKDKSEVFVKVGEPEIADFSLTGITLGLSAEINSVNQNGTVDFLTFYDFRVNNLKVEIADYTKPFEIRKNQQVVLPEPIKIFIATSQTLRGALNEYKDAQEEWTVTGRVFIFGHFKKSFLKFKRVVPVEINLKIKNPLRGVQADKKQN